MPKALRTTAVALAAVLLAMLTVSASASTPGGDSRLSHDALDPGYVTSYFIATGDVRTSRPSEWIPATPM